MAAFDPERVPWPRAHPALWATPRARPNSVALAIGACIGALAAGSWTLAIGIAFVETNRPPPVVASTHVTVTGANPPATAPSVEGE